MASVSQFYKHTRLLIYAHACLFAKLINTKDI